jgi:hypothetical protein
MLQTNKQAIDVRWILEKHGYLGDSAVVEPSRYGANMPENGLKQEQYLTSDRQQGLARLQEKHRRLDKSLGLNPICQTTDHLFPTADRLWCILGVAHKLLTISFGKARS